MVVPSHDRPLRLRWLLNALADQTLSRERFEVLVGHDSAGTETAELLATHPLAQAGILRSVAHAPGSSPPGRNRNAAWRLARAPVIAFTDDDCRPPPEWLERALAASARHSGAIVQGATRPDPAEATIRAYAPYVSTQSIAPPRPWAQACNIIYPIDVLEAAGGFPEDMYVGEDTALVERARAAGVEYVGAKEVITSHAIEERSLVQPGARRLALAGPAPLARTSPTVAGRLSSLLLLEARAHLAARGRRGYRAAAPQPRVGRARDSIPDARDAQEIRSRAPGDVARPARRARAWR